jgi:O-succinylbenzoic acid--CoA ligase
MTLLPHFVEDEFLARLAAPDRQPRVSVVSLVPTMLTRLLDAGWVRPEGLEAAVIGGAPLGAELRERAIEAGIPIRESWGMTETLGMISVTRTDSCTGVGQPLPGVEVRASDAGELLVRGPIVAPGLSDEEGWFHTNDSGYVDERGFVHVEGRVGSMIISGGENVFPEAVERALLATGLLEDVLVRGEADPEWGQRVVADAVPKLPTTTPSEVRAAVIAQLARWELPKEINFVEQIKRDKLGKVVRHSNG